MNDRKKRKRCDGMIAMLWSPRSKDGRDLPSRRKQEENESAGFILSFVPSVGFPWCAF